VPRFSVYQLGRGSEPVIVVGSVISLVARYISLPSRLHAALFARDGLSNLASRFDR
jgi:hypothetical protein